jgi:NADH dehydrogenase
MNDIERFILMSVQGAVPNHPMELFRMKYLTEQQLQASGLPWTVIRPTAYMETWAALVGEPLLKTGKTTIFGRGDNPINFVSVYDIAQFVELAVTDPAMQGVMVEVGGPENITMRQVVQTFETVSGKHSTMNSVPLPVMRLLTVLMRPVKPALASQIQAGIVMDTLKNSFDSTETSRRYPSIALTNWAGVVRRDYMLN